jgi:hypothetical protein
MPLGGMLLAELLAELTPEPKYHILFLYRLGRRISKEYPAKRSR